MTQRQLKLLKKKYLGEGYKKGYKKALLEYVNTPEQDAYAKREYQKMLDNMAWNIESEIKSWAKNPELEMVLSNLDYDSLAFLLDAFAVLDD